MQNLVIAGGGVLGSQIGFQSAFKGKNVTFWLRSEESIERARKKIDGLKKTYKKELEDTKSEIGRDRPIYSNGLIEDFDTLTEEKIDELIDNVDKAYESIRYETDLENAVKDADFLIEAVAEIEDVKHDFYKKVKEFLPEKTIIASNSSTMLPSTFAKDANRPEKYLHFHFANKIWKLNIGEIMLNPKTDPKTKDAVVEFAKEIGMVPVIIEKEQPGYILNSLLVPLLDAAQALLVKEVASAEDIDKTWKISVGAPLGPFEILDVVGMQTPYNLAKAKPDANDPNSVSGKTIKLFEKMIEEGKTGLMAGEGFYKYDENGNKIK